MNDDLIVAEVRNARDEYAQRFNYDLDAICNDLQQRQIQSGRKLVAFPPRRPIPGSQAGTQALPEPSLQVEPDKPCN